MGLYRLFILCHNSVNHFFNNYANVLNFTEAQCHKLTAHWQVHVFLHKALFDPLKPRLQGRVNFGALPGSWLCQGTWTLSRVRDAAQW